MIKVERKNADKYIQAGRLKWFRNKGLFVILPNGTRIKVVENDTLSAISRERAVIFYGEWPFV